MSSAFRVLLLSWVLAQAAAAAPPAAPPPPPKGPIKRTQQKRLPPGRVIRLKEGQKTLDLRLLKTGSPAPPPQVKKPGRPIRFGTGMLPVRRPQTNPKRRIPSPKPKTAPKPVTQGATK